MGCHKGKENRVAPIITSGSNFDMFFREEREFLNNRKIIKKYKSGCLATSISVLGYDVLRECKK